MPHRLVGHQASVGVVQQWSVGVNVDDRRRLPLVVPQVAGIHPQCAFLEAPIRPGGPIVDLAIPALSPTVVEGRSSMCQKSRTQGPAATTTASQSMLP